MPDRSSRPALDAADPCSRRGAVTLGAGGLFCWLIAGSDLRAQTPAAQPSVANEIRATRAIHQEEDFNAAPQRIYDALTNAKQFRAFSGGLATEIHPEVGGTFSVFDAHIVGRNVELVPHRRIVQAWRVVDWPEGVHSIARFELTPRGSGTKIIFDHTGFPSDLAEHLATGWHEHYWDLLRKYLV